MPRVSKRLINKELDQLIKDNFSYLISFLNSTHEINLFFNTFLTDEEKTMLGKRLTIHIMLENKIENHQIQSTLKVSQDTVRIHKIVWKNADTSYKEILVKIAKNKKTKEFIKKVVKFFEPLESFLQAKTNMKARAKFLNPDI